jgi:hypothetical protein
MPDEPKDREDGRIRLAFDRDFLTIPVAAIVPLKTLPNGARESRSYSQVLSSIKAIGLIEAPVVMADEKNAGAWFLLDGHLRLEALKELGISEVECLLAADDDTYTYNKRVNRIPPIQEHRMIVRAMDRGVSSADIAACPEPPGRVRAAAFPIAGRDQSRGGRDAERHALLDEGVRHPAPDDGRQADRSCRPDDRPEQFLGHVCARAACGDVREPARHHQQGKRGGKPTPSGQQIARMERELAALQTQVKSVEETYGIDNLHLTVARGYIAKLLANNRVVRWLATHQQDYLSEFQKIAEIDRLGPIAETPDA